MGTRVREERTTYFMIWCVEDNVGKCRITTNINQEDVSLGRSHDSLLETVGRSGFLTKRWSWGVCENQRNDGLMTSEGFLPWSFVIFTSEAFPAMINHPKLLFTTNLMFEYIFNISSPNVICQLNLCIWCSSFMVKIHDCVLPGSG